MLLSFGQGSLWRAVPRRPGQQLLPDAAAASLAGSIFPMALHHVPASLHWRPGRSAAPLRRPSRSAAASRWLSATSLPVCTGVLAGQLLRYGAPAGQQLLPDAAAAADLSAGVTPRSGAVTFPHRLPLRSIPCSASTSNKPHSAAKSTPVWLAIWRIWAGFANSQLLSAAFRSTY